MSSKNQFPIIPWHGDIGCPLPPEVWAGLADLIDIHDINEEGATLRPYAPLFRVLALAGLLHEHLTPDKFQEILQDWDNLSLT